MSIAEVVFTAADRFTSAIAVQDNARSLTYSQLGDRVGRLARGLGEIPLKPGSAVLVLLPNSVAAVEVDLALAVAGLIRVSLNPRLGPDDWELIRQDCRPEAMIIDPRISAAVEFARHASLPRIVTSEVVGSNDALHLLDDVVATASAGRTLPEPDLDSLCGLHYSSGTTGRPKGAKRTHANRLTSMRAMIDHVLSGTLDGPCPVFLHAGPIIHTSGLFVLPFLHSGGRQVLLDHPSSRRLVDAVDIHQATHTALVPTVIARLLDLDDATLSVMRRLRMLAYAGAPMPAEHIRQAYRRITPNLVQYYGMVEAIPPLTVLGVDDHHRGMTTDTALLESVGQPCPHVRIEFADTAGPVSDGAVGELVLAGPAVGPGYHNAENRSDLGKSHLDGQLYSGDLGFRSADGYIHLTGRRGDMIITGGYNVYPREVEEAIAGIPGVSEVVVAGVPDPVWGQQIVAAYTTHPEATLTEDDVAAENRCRLPDFKRPKAVRCVHSLPLTAFGKIDRAQATSLLADLIRTTSPQGISALNADGTEGAP